MPTGEGTLKDPTLYRTENGGIGCKIVIRCNCGNTTIVNIEISPNHLTRALVSLGFVEISEE